MEDDKRPHVDTWKCGRCRQEIQAGHRIVQALISQGKGRNPTDIMHMGLMISEEFEFVHVDCHDPFLHKGLSD